MTLCSISSEFITKPSSTMPDSWSSVIEEMPLEHVSYNQMVLETHICVHNALVIQKYIPSTGSVRPIRDQDLCCTVR